jgi:hypothetical protein
VTSNRGQCIESAPRTSLPLRRQRASPQGRCGLRRPRERRAHTQRGATGSSIQRAFALAGLPSLVM